MDWLTTWVLVLARGYKLVFFRRFLPGTFEQSNSHLLATLTISSLVVPALVLTTVKDFYGVEPNGINAEIAGWVMLALIALALKSRDRLINVRELVVAIAIGSICINILATAALKALFNVNHAGLSKITLMAISGLSLAIMAWPFATAFWAGRQLGQFGIRLFGMRALVALVLSVAVVPRAPMINTGMPDAFDKLNIWPVISTWVDKQLYLSIAKQDAKPVLPPLDFEKILDRQPEMVAQALEKLTLSNTADPDLYFVGMASYAEQDVFTREIKATRELFDSRFKAAGHSIVLNNHRDTIEQLPLASATNLRKILAGIGKKMNRDRDVLVLFMTSHGAENVLSISFNSAPLSNLTPGALATMLDDAGIKNRVIVVSACHSGSFIPALKNDDTLILTASHADKASFGCSNECDWTYFSDALINHALRTTHSFTEAFQQARTLVTDWEKRDGLSPPSDPQIFEGSAIGAKLDALTKPLDEKSAEAVIK